MYFWMIDRGDLPDDQRNQVSMQRQKVVLHREHGQRVLNGVYVGRLMHAIRKVILKKSRKPFTLDPVLQNLKDNSQVQAREYNWNYLVAELKKFNIKVSKDQKSQIVYDAKQLLVIDVLQQLKQFDQELSQSKDGSVIGSFPNSEVQSNIGSKKQGQVGSKSTAQLKRLGIDNGDGRNVDLRGSSVKKTQGIMENNSEINYGVNSYAIERQYGNRDNNNIKRIDIDRPESHLNGSLDYQNDIFKGDSISKVSNNSKSEVNLSGVNLNYNFGKPKDSRQEQAVVGSRNQQEEYDFGTRKKNSDATNSLIQLHQIKAPLMSDPDEKDGSLSKVLDDIGYDKATHATDASSPHGRNIYDSMINQSMDQQANSKLMESDTVATFIFNSLKYGMGLDNSQVAQLLQQNYRFLALLCIRGTKGGDYKTLLDWYSLVINNLPHFVRLLLAVDVRQSHEGDQLAKSLNILRSGLLSKNSDVVNICTRFFTKFRKYIGDNAANDSDVQQLLHGFWDWLSFEQSNASIQSFARQPQQQVSPGRTRTNSKKPQPSNQNQGQEILLKEQGMKSFLRALAKHQTHFVEQFAGFIITAGTDNYVELFMRVIRDASQNNYHYLSSILQFYEVLIKSQLGKRAFLQTGVFYQIMDLALRILEDQIDVQLNEQNFIQEKQIALILLTDFWKSRPDMVQAKENRGRLTDNIQQALMRGCRDNQKVVSILSINLMVLLIDQFAKDRNEQAPILYKALTFIFIEQYNNIDVREEILHNFIKLFKIYQGMPITILCDPLLKQIQLNLDKQETVDGTQNILQPQSNFFTLNTTDFEFFLYVAVHPKLPPETAVELLKVALKVSRVNIIFTRVSLKLTLTLLNRFENNQQVYEFCQQHVQDMMRLIENQDLAKVIMYNRLMKDPKTHLHSKRKSMSNKALAQQSGQNLGGADIPAFSNLLANKNTHNVKFQAQEKAANGPISNLTLDKSTSLAASVANGRDLLDNKGPKQDSSQSIQDSDLQRILNPNLNQEDSSMYMQMLTNEKMIINQLQCFIGTGIKVLVDYIRQQTLQAYTKTEKKLKFRNKGLYHLLKLMAGEANVLSLLAMYQQDLERQRQEKIRLRKERVDQERRKKLELEETEDFYGGENYSPGSGRLALPPASKTEESNNDYFRLPQIHPKTDLRKKPVIKRQVSLGGARNRQQSISANKPTYAYDSNVSLPNDRSNQAQIYQAGPISGSLSKQKYSTPVKSAASRKLGEPVSVTSLRRNQLYQQEEPVKLYSLSEEVTLKGCPPEEIGKYLTWLKVNQKLYRAMYNKYSNISKNKQPSKKMTFDLVKSNQEQMTLTEVYSFLNDFKLNHTNLNGLKRDQIKRIIKLINVRQENNFNNSITLDFHGFTEFVLQIGYHHSFGSIQRPSIFLPVLWQFMKERSLESSLPLFQRLFEDPYSSQIGDPVILKELTAKVNQDPNFVLPPGYIKFKKDIFVQELMVPPHLPESHQIAVEILDDIFVDALDMHMIRPEIVPRQVWGVKPDIFQQNLKKNTQSKHRLLAEQYKDKDEQIQARQEAQYDQQMRRQDSMGGDQTNGGVRSMSGMQADTPAAMSEASFRSLQFMQARSLKPLPSHNQQNFTPTMRLLLLQNENKPNFTEYKAAAGVLADMTRVLEQGLAVKVDLEQINRKYQTISAAKIGVKAPKNRLEAKQVADAVNQRLQSVKKNIDFFEQDRRTKARLQRQRQEHQHKEALEAQHSIEQARQQMLADIRKKEAKQRYYQSIQEKYLEETLPTILEKQKENEVKQKQDAQKVRQRKADLAKQINEDAQHLSNMYNMQYQAKKEQAQSKIQAEQLAKQRLAKKNAKLAQSFANRQKLKETQAISSSVGQSASQQHISVYQNARINPSGRQSTLLQSSKKDDSEHTYSNIASTYGGASAADGNNALKKPIGQQLSPPLKQQHTFKTQAEKPANYIDSSQNVSSDNRGVNNTSDPTSTYLTSQTKPTNALQAKASSLRQPDQLDRQDYLSNKTGNNEAKSSQNRKSSSIRKSSSNRQTTSNNSGITPTSAYGSQIKA